MAANKRMSRVDAEVQKALANIISKFDDIDFATSLISVMKVETTSDFSFAKVFVRVLGEKEKPSINTPEITLLCSSICDKIRKMGDIVFPADIL